jgi:hypothetical protein
VYVFPTWFLRYAVHAIFEVSIAKFLTFNLVVRRRIPWEGGNIL